MPGRCVGDRQAPWSASEEQCVRVHTDLLTWVTSCHSHACGKGGGEIRNAGSLSRGPAAPYGRRVGSSVSEQSRSPRLQPQPTATASAILVVDEAQAAQASPHHVVFVKEARRASE